MPRGQIAKGDHICPECKAVGTRTVYEYASGLGVHRKNAHGIMGSSLAAVHARKGKAMTTEPILPAPTLPEIVKRGRPKGSASIFRCFYCERTFPRINARTKHIHESHLGMDAYPQKGNNAHIETEEDKDAREYAIRSAGYLEGLCHGMASAKGYPPEEFTAGVARYLTAFTLR